MKKILISEMHFEGISMNLRYYLTLDGNKVGVEIRDDSGNMAACVVPDTPERVLDFLYILAECGVMIGHLRDVTEDYIHEHFLTDTVT